MCVLSLMGFPSELQNRGDCEIETKPKVYATPMLQSLTELSIHRVSLHDHINMTE